MSDLHGLLRALYDIRIQKAAMDKAEKQLLGELKSLVDPEFDKAPDEPIAEGGLVLARISGTSRVISADLLLERGVSPDVIASATKTTPYYQYRVKEAK